eukprot:5951667-Amphidinium_carterae.1
MIMRCSSPCESCGCAPQHCPHKQRIRQATCMDRRPLQFHLTKLSSNSYGASMWPAVTEGGRSRMEICSSLCGLLPS